MMNAILPLLLADLTEAWHIEQASHAFPWSAKTFAGNQGERYLNFKLCVGNRIAAFAITHTVLDEASLFNIAVHPDFQWQVLTLWLEVRQSNEPAIALYRALGFNEVSIRRHYYPSAGGREDAVIMAPPPAWAHQCLPTPCRICNQQIPFRQTLWRTLVARPSRGDHEERPLRRRNCGTAHLRNYFAP